MRDDRLFEALYRKYYRRIVRFYVQSFRLAEEDAEELAQDAFMRFYRSMDDYRGDAEWAFFEMIARRVAYNRIRTGRTKKRSGLRVDIDDPEITSEPIAPQGPDYAEREEQTERTRRLREAIRKLPSGQRQCIHLQLEGFKYQEIGKALRISGDAVKSRLRDARKSLREALGSDLALPEDES